MNNYQVGIDEAGYGPLLGPLVVSAVVFKVPSYRVNLWRVLDKIVSLPRRPGGARPPACATADRYGRQAGRQHRITEKISVCDSKLLYQSQRGIKPLETSVLAFASLLPQIKLPLSRLTADQFIKKLTRSVIPIPTQRYRERNLSSSYEPFSAFPWCDEPYQVKIPLEADLAEINRLALALRQECQTKSTQLDAVHIRTIHPDQFNGGIQRYHNKAELLFETTAQLLKVLQTDYLQPGRRTEIYIDKQGGRTYYQAHLQRLFEPVRVLPLKQTRDKSSYYLNQPMGSKCHIGFIKGGELSQFTIALASMFSKYLRELHMKMFNSFWQRHLPRLKPTAGYPQDGRRFIKQILPLSQQLGISPVNFIRMR